MGSGPEFRGPEFAAATLRSLLPMIERLGIATAEEIDVETLAGRLRAEATAADATTAAVSLVAAWTRVDVD